MSCSDENDIVQLSSDGENVEYDISKVIRQVV